MAEWSKAAGLRSASEITAWVRSPQDAISVKFLNLFHNRNKSGYSMGCGFCSV